MGKMSGNKDLGGIFRGWRKAVAGRGAKNRSEVQQTTGRTA